MFGELSGDKREWILYSGVITRLLGIEDLKVARTKDGRKILMIF